MGDKCTGKKEKGREYRRAKGKGSCGKISADGSTQSRMQTNYKEIDVYRESSRILISFSPADVALSC